MNLPWEPNRDSPLALEARIALARAEVLRLQAAEQHAAQVMNMANFLDPADKSVHDWFKAMSEHAIAIKELKRVLAERT